MINMSNYFEIKHPIIHLYNENGYTIWFNDYNSNIICMDDYNCNHPRWCFGVQTEKEMISNAKRLIAEGREIAHIDKKYKGKIINKKLFLVPISKTNINICFNKANWKNRQAIYWKELYTLAFPYFDNIEKIDGFPRLNIKTNEYIINKCIEFDKKYHSNVMAGGLWMDKGFGTTKNDIPEWMIDLSEVKVKIKVKEVDINGKTILINK